MSNNKKERKTFISLWAALDNGGPDCSRELRHGVILARHKESKITLRSTFKKGAARDYHHYGFHVGYVGASQYLDSEKF